MDKEHFLNLFGLNSEERNLKLLICSQEKLEFNAHDKAFTKEASSSEISSKIKNGMKNIQFVPVWSQLPYENQAFDLALCHDLFSSMPERETEPLKYFMEAISELTRVASEVRIFPLIDKQGKPFASLGPIIQSLQDKGLGVELKQVQQGGVPAALMRLWNESCTVETR